MNSQHPGVRESRGWSVAYSSALLTGSRVVSAIAVNKIIAIYLGPSGLALVGQFQNFTAVVFGMTGGNVSNAVIATVSAARDELGRRHAVSTAVAVIAAGTGATALLVAMWSRRIADYLFQDSTLAPVLLGFALLMLPLILNVVLLAIVAGLGRVREFVAINVAFTVVSVVVCWVMVLRYGTAGALLSAVVTNSAAVLATGAWLWRTRPFPLNWLWAGVNPAATGRLLRLAAMTLSTIIALPAAQLVVRQVVVNDFGHVAAGHWQAALKTGEILLMGASLIVSLHFLPQFSRHGADLRRSALVACGRLIGCLALAGAVFAAAGALLLPVLFSSDFVAAAEWLPIQLAGDVLRSGVLVLQAAFLARMRMLSYLTVDLVYAFVMVGVGMLVVPHDGPRGAVFAVLAASASSLCAALLLLLLRRTTWEEAR